MMEISYLAEELLFSIKPSFMVLVSCLVVWLVS
jgi:hypothetical protein